MRNPHSSNAYQNGHNATALQQSTRTRERYSHIDTAHQWDPGYQAGQPLYANTPPQFGSRHRDYRASDDGNLAAAGVWKYNEPKAPYMLAEQERPTYVSFPKPQKRGYHSMESTQGSSLPSLQQGSIQPSIEGPGTPRAADERFAEPKRRSLPSNVVYVSDQQQGQGLYEPRGENSTVPHAYGGWPQSFPLQDREYVDVLDLAVPSERERRPTALASRNALSGTIHAARHHPYRRPGVVTDHRAEGRRRSPDIVQLDGATNEDLHFHRQFREANPHDGMRQTNRLFVGSIAKPPGEQHLRSRRQGGDSSHQTQVVPGYRYG